MSQRKIRHIMRPESEVGQPTAFSVLDKIDELVDAVNLLLKKSEASK